MATLLEADGKKLVAGLTWRRVSDLSQAEAEIDTYAREANAKRYVRLTAGDAGLATGFLADATVPAGALSIAALFTLTAGLPQAALLLMDTPKGSILVGVRDGLPASGFDAFGDRASMMELASEFITLSSSAGITIYSNTQAFPNSIPIDFSELLHANAKTARIVTYNRNSKYMVMLLALLVVISAAAGGYWWYLLEQEAAAKRAARQRDPNVRYEAAVPAALASVGMRPAAFATQILPAIGQMPERAAGWRMVSADCAASACTSSWEIESGTFQSFRDAFPQAAIQYEVSGTTLKVKNAFSVDAPAIDRGALRPIDDFMLATVSRFQLWRHAGWQFRLTEPKVFGLPPGVAAESILNPVLYGGWEAIGDFWMLDAFKEMPDAMTLEQMVVRNDAGKITFIAKGNFYGIKAQ